MVELTSMMGLRETAYTDANGRATFNVPQGYSYRVGVSGPGIKSTTADFEIESDEFSHYESVPVTLVAGGAPASQSGATVSAALLTVPGDARKEFKKGMDDFHAEHWDSAKKHFEKATEDYPKFDWAFNNLGVADMHTGDVRAARAAFEKAVAVNGSNPDATRNLARFKLSDLDYRGAEALLQKSLQTDPQNAQTLMLLSFVQYRNKELDSALSNAERVHQGEIDLAPYAHLIAARILEQRGDRTGAEKQYAAYLKEAPNSPEAHLAKEGLVRVEAKQ